MKITYHGLSCFTIEHDKVRVITDPFDPKTTGLTLPKVKPDFVTVSHDHAGHNNVSGLEGTPKVFDWPGEYEANDIIFHGITAYHFSEEDDAAKGLGEVTLFVIRFSDLTVCHLGDLGHRIPTRLIEIIGDVDILLIPVGGEHTIGAKKAEEIVNSIEPRIVIPMHYALPELKRELEGVDKFLKEMGANGITPQKILDIKRSDLNTEKTQVVQLEVQ